MFFGYANLGNLSAMIFLRSVYVAALLYTSGFLGFEKYHSHRTRA
jgi:hypothetical protein